MEGQFKETALKVFDFNDCESVSYCYEDKCFKFTIVGWKLDVIEIEFNDVILFADWGGVNLLSNVYINNANTEFFRRGLRSRYRCSEQEIPLVHPYKLFQFVDSTNDLCYEIVSADFKFNVNSAKAWRVD
jgi:hypothetical protein